jgi:hypothetical protein
MGKTGLTAATIASVPFGLYQFYVNPLAMGTAVGSGIVLDQGVKAGLEVVDASLNEQGKELTDAQKNAIRIATGFLQGSGAYK